MPSLLFTNAFFEEELAHPCPQTLDHYLTYPSLALHLHFLSCLTAEDHETPLLALVPDEDYLSSLSSSPLYLHSPLPSHSHLHSWGPSYALTSWAQERGCSYKTPSLELVRHINSKAFPLTLGKNPSFSRLVASEKDLVEFWKEIKGPKVLKSLQGASGKGHFLSKRDEADLPLAIQFLHTHKEVLAEPWLPRLLDFSSQWYIDPDHSYRYLGVTLCQNSPRGVYRGSIAGPPDLLFQEYLPYVEEHLIHAKEVVEHIAKLSPKGCTFFGPLGFDAMLFELQGVPTLYPILEINARRTMGWVALRLHEKLGKEGLTQMRYSLKKTGKKSLLPHRAYTKEGTLLHFTPELIIETGLSKV